MLRGDLDGTVMAYQWYEGLSVHGHHDHHVCLIEVVKRNRHSEY